MSATAQTIWQVPAYLPYLQPPLTDEIIASAEKSIGYKLPAEYLELLRVQNGGYIRYTLPGTVHCQINGIGPHFPSLTGFDWDEYREYVSFELDGLFPFDGDGHWYLCIDYRTNPLHPAVTYIDTECDEQSEVAPNFSTYLSVIEPDVDEDDFVILTVLDIEDVKSSIADALGVTFEAPDSWAHGYPIHRARGGTDENPEWIWIGPNIVPRAFVRGDDSRYEELRHLMPGEAPRYPQLPDSCFLLSMTDGLRSSVLETCKQQSMDVRPLIEFVI